MPVAKGDSPPLDSPFLADAEMFCTLADAVYSVVFLVVVDFQKSFYTGTTLSMQYFDCRRGRF